MPTTPEQVCGLALSKLGADPIVNLAAPQKPNDKLLARIYPHYRDAELRRHRWLFAISVIQMTPAGAPIVNDLDGTLYRFPWPADALRAVRYPGVTWITRGRELLDPSTSITGKFVLRADPGLWDPLFEEALACRLAIESCEKVTQSTDKKQDLTADYKAAIDQAKVANAVELGPEDISNVDDNYSWLTARLQ